MTKTKAAKHSSPMKRGKWADEEHKRLVEAFSIHRTDWVSVAPKVETRSRTQCRSHY